MGASRLTYEEALALSKPYLSGFNPYVIPYQGYLVDLVRSEWDYSKGNLEILLSGSFGSAKSIAMAHLAVTHCLLYPRARVCIARRALPDLKDTIFKEILEHMEGYDEENSEGPQLVDGVHYTVNQSRAYIRFSNGSEIISRSWADKKYKKGRSLKLSMLIIEELTENDSQDQEAFKTLKARIRRLPHVPENLMICATNPDEPDHWVYKYWMDSNDPCRKVFYSVTEDNPFLDPVYIEQLKRGYSPQEADRFLRGMWLSITGEGVYYNYDTARNFKRDDFYQWDLRYPISLMHDFNIGHGKPMSAAIGQHINGIFHIAKTFIIEGLNTPKLMDEIAASGIFELKAKLQVYGDAAGRNRDTRNSKSDYDIIEKFITNYVRQDGSFVEVEMNVPLSNPAIRTRHNKMNALFKNDLGEVKFYIYKDAKDLDEGLRLTKLKKGAHLIEDDSFKFQHVTTAVGYWVYYVQEYGDTVAQVKMY